LGAEAGENERPVRRATFTAFRLGATPVTVAMWREFAAASGVPMPEAPEWGWIDDHPMVNVSWSDVCGDDGRGGYCGWASRVAGVAIQLPTEWQWEAAVRGGASGAAFPWGDAFDIDRLWCSVKTRLESTASVGRTESIHRNRYGLVDMSGNVWEWCRDAYREDPPSGLVDPAGPTRGASRCVRGGSWINGNPNNFRCAFRTGFPGTSREEYVGFRLCAPPRGA